MVMFFNGSATNTPMRIDLHAAVLGAPAGIEVSVASAASVTLTWLDNSTGEDGFSIERSTDGVSYAQIDTVAENVTTYTDTGLTTDDTYYYRVRAYAASGYSDYSGIVSIAPNGLLVNLYGYWPMDDAANGTREDAVGRAHFNDINTVAAAAAVINNGASFTAANSERLRRKHDLGAFEQGDADFSIAAWVYLTDKSQNRAIVTKWGPTEFEFALEYESSTDRFRFFVQGGTTTTVVRANNFGAPSLSTWYFVVGSHDAANNQIAIEVNRGTADTAAHSVGVDTTETIALIGARNGGGSVENLNWNGIIDEVGYWRRLLTSDELNTLYNGGSGYSSMTTLAARLAPATKQPDGVWSWFSDPRALRFNGNTYVSWINTVGDIQIASFADGAKTSQFYTLKYAMEVDDHDNPALLIRDSDSKILAFYAKHAQADIYLRISTSAEDVSAWESEVNLDSSIGDFVYTYAQPIQLTGETNDPIYLFYRGSATSGGNQQWYFTKSEDDGATWAGRTALWVDAYGDETTQAYIKAVANGNGRIDFVATDGHPVHINTSIYHFYYTGGNYYKTDGTLIGNSSVLPLDPSDLTAIYDGTTTPAFLWDIAVDGSGYPVIVYATFPTTSDHRYRYARWTGSAWIDNEITAAGGTVEGTGSQLYYSGGVVLDHDEPDNVYLSKEVSSVHEIYKYTTGDNGATWSYIALTSGSTYKNFRPVYIRNAGAIKVLWIQGYYNEYTDYSTLIKSSAN